MQEQGSVLDKFYRGALSAYIFILVLLIYSGTNDPTIDSKLLLTSWAALILTGSYILLTWITRTPLRRSPIFKKVLLALLVLFFIRSLFSEFRAVSLLETSRFLALFGLYWLAAQVFRNTDHILRFFNVFAVAMGVAALYALVQAAGLDPFPWTDTTSDTYTNLPATFGNPNFAAHALILSIIMIIGSYIMGAKWTPWLLPLLFFHLYRTDQRAGWIALAGAAFLVAVSWVALRHAQRPTGRVVASVLVVGFVGASVVGSVMYWTYLKTGFAFPLDLSLLIRYQSYVSATNMLLDAPVLGHGPAVYGLAYAPYWTPFEQDWFAQELRMNAHVHNDLLELAIDGGIFAAGLYLAALTLGVCYGLLLAARGTTATQRRLGYVFAALFTAFAIDGLFGFNLRVPVTAAVFFILMGLLEGMWSPAPAETVVRRRWPVHAFRVGLLVALLLAARQETRSFASDYHFYTGMRAHTDGRFEEARAAYSRAEEEAPWNFHAPRRIAMTYVDEGNPALSTPHFDRAMDLNPHYLLARLPMAQASLVSAQESLREGAAGVADARNHLDEAREDANYLLTFAPNFPAAHTTLGRIESIAAIIERDFATPANTEAVTAHWDSARQHLEQAIACGAKNGGELYTMLMHVAVGLNDLPSAEAALRGAVQANDNYLGRAWALYFNLATETKNYTGMRDTLQRQIEVLRQQQSQEDDPATKEALVTTYAWLATVQAQGYQEVDRALDALAQILQLAPLREEIWARFANLARENGKGDRLEQVVRDSRDSLALSETESLPQVAAVAAVLDDAGQFTQASRTVLAAVRATPPTAQPNAKALYGWAVQWLLERYDALAATNDAPCEPALDLGIASVGIEDYARGADLLEQASECLQDERKAIARIHWADAMVRLGKADEALPKLEEAAVAFPDHLDTQWAIARTLATLGRFEEARSRYERLLAMPGLPQEITTQLQAEQAQLVAPN